MQVWSIVSAFLLSYWVSRGVARLPFLSSLKGAAFIIVVHLISGVGLFVVLGMFKAYFLLFATRQAVIVLVSQAVWAALDLAFTGHRVLAGRREY